jgi:hypothetical protein
MDREHHGFTVECVLKAQVELSGVILDYVGQSPGPFAGSRILPTYFPEAVGSARDAERALSAKVRRGKRQGFLYTNPPLTAPTSAAKSTHKILLLDFAQSLSLFRP